MPASLLETTAAAPAAAAASRARLPAGRAAVAARGAVGGAGHRAVRGRAGRPLRARAGRTGWAFFLACYAAGGWEPGLAGLRALRAKTLDVDLLMVVAAIGAAAIGQVLDGGLLIVIFATSGALEAVATHRTAQAVRGLLDLAPEQATRLDGDGRRAAGGRGEPAVGDVILVRPGERIGADGQVLSGCQRRGSGHDHRRAAAGRQEPRRRGVRRHRQRHRRAAGAGRAGPPPTPWSPGSSPWSSRPRRPRPGRSCSSRRSSSGTRSAWSPRRCCCSLIPLLAGAAFQPTLLRAMTFMIVASPCAVVLATMPPLLAAMANAGPARRPGQVRRRDGAARRHDPGRVRQDRHPDRGHPAADRDHRPARRRPGRTGGARPGRGGREPLRAPAGPRRRRRRARRRARHRPRGRVHLCPRAAASAP